MLSNLFTCKNTTELISRTENSTVCQMAKLVYQQRIVQSTGGLSVFLDRYHWILTSIAVCSGIVVARVEAVQRNLRELELARFSEART